MIKQLSQQFSLGEHLSFAEIYQGFPVIKVNNERASAVISLYGGQILEYQPHEQAEPVLWLSDKAIYQADKAIRGGIPVCWPWFGDYVDGALDKGSLPAHGFARTSFWQVYSTESLANGDTKIVLHMPCQGVCRKYQTIETHFMCDLMLQITIGDKLKIDLITTNQGEYAQPISNALHAYFNVSDIHNISISGLEQINYLDKLQHGKKLLQETAFSLTQETDRVFIDTKSDIKLTDQGFKRTIIIEKENSLSTVVWNPWKENSKQMSDMADDGWLSMVCIEPANVPPNQFLLNPGQTQQLSASIHVKSNTYP